MLTGGAMNATLKAAHILEPCCLVVLLQVSSFSSLLLQEFEAGLLILSPDQAGSSTDTYVHNSNVNSLTSSAAVVPRLSNTDSRAASGQSSTTLVTAAQHGKASGSGLCKTLLAPLLSKDLQEALAGCKRQLGELMAENSKQMMLVSLRCHTAVLARHVQN